MSNSRVWVFRGLVIVAGGLMLLSWFMPWWSCVVYELGSKDIVVIHPYGLWQNTAALGPWVSFLKGAEMPVWFAPFAWTYLGICVILLLYSLFAKEKTFNLGKFRLSLPQVLIGCVGLSYILTVIIAVIVAAIRTADFGMHLIGYSYIDRGYPYVSDAHAGFLFGYWLAWGVGLLLIALALLRNRIIGKAKLIVR